LFRAPGASKLNNSVISPRSENLQDGWNKVDNLGYRMTYRSLH